MSRNLCLPSSPDEPGATSGAVDQDEPAGVRDLTVRSTTPDALRPTVGRLAPSPTGGLHLGHARSFLIAWLAARQADGRIVLRIEDLDGSRVRPEASTAALDDLAWLGLDWDEGPHIQSERTTLYACSLEHLKRLGSIYPCTCSRGALIYVIWPKKF